jgi:hypothetical protein
MQFDHINSLRCGPWLRDFADVPKCGRVLRIVADVRKERRPHGDLASGGENQ